MLPVDLLSANEKIAFIDVEYIIQNSIIGKKSLDKIQVLNEKNIIKLEKKNKILIQLEKSIMSKKNINVGIIGLGVGEAHLKSYRRLKNVNVLAICDINTKKLREVGKKYDIEYQFENYKKRTTKIFFILS